MGSKLYYRFDAIGIDCFDEDDIKEHSRELISASCLNEQFDKLRAAYEQATCNRADVIINAVPEISGILEIAAYHKIAYKLFSRKVKSNCFCVCITHIDDCEKLRLYFLRTDDFYAVKKIFTDFIEFGKRPDLSAWKCKYIGL